MARCEVEERMMNFILVEMPRKLKCKTVLRARGCELGNPGGDGQSHVQKDICVWWGERASKGGEEMGKERRRKKRRETRDRD